jgi:hypothetical protein
VPIRDRLSSQRVLTDRRLLTYVVARVYDARIASVELLRNGVMLDRSRTDRGWVLLAAVVPSDGSLSGDLTGALTGRSAAGDVIARGALRQELGTAWC